MTGSSRGRANSRVRSHSESEMDSTSRIASDTDGWSHGVQDNYGVANQRGTNEAWSRGSNRSTTRGQTITKSTQETNGYSNTVGHTSTRGGAFTKGQTITRGKSVAEVPFHEYHREEIATPVFFTPEEQRLLVMQRLARIPERHFLLKAPYSNDCIIRAPEVPDPVISDRRLSAGLDTVYNALPCYSTSAEQQRGEMKTKPDQSSDDVIDVEEVEEVHTPQSVVALPSPAPPDNLTEAELWDRWHAMGHGKKHRQEN